MKEIVVAIVCVMGALLVGFIGIRLNRKLFQTPKTTLSGATITSLGALIGFVVGMLIIPVTLIPENSYTRIALAVGMISVLGVIELKAITRLSKKWQNDYILDRDTFPFVSLGFSCAILLKPYFLSI